MRRLMDMHAGSEVNGLNAYGTSEGVKKAWDTRGRGQSVVKKAGDYGFSGSPHGGTTVMRHEDNTKGIQHKIMVQNNGNWAHHFNGQQVGGGDAKSFGNYMKERSEGSLYGIQRVRGPHEPI